MMSLEEFICFSLDGFNYEDYGSLPEHLTDRILDAVGRGEIKELSLTTKA